MIFWFSLGLSVGRAGLVYAADSAPVIPGIPTPDTLPVSPYPPLPPRPFGAHPDGTLVINNGTIYLIQNAELAGFRDAAEYLSQGYSFSQVVSASVEDMTLPQTTVVKARPGTLVIDARDNQTVYMIGDNGTKRGFVSVAVFKALGYHFGALPKINLADYPTGPPIASPSEAHPDGSLVSDGQTIWWIQNGQKQGFASTDIFASYGLSLTKVVAANNADRTLPTGELVKFRDGTLILDGLAYYIISDGQKLRFVDQDALINHGYNPANAILASTDSYYLASFID